MGRSLSGCCAAFVKICPVMFLCLFGSVSIYLNSFVLWKWNQCLRASLFVSVESSPSVTLLDDAGGFSLCPPSASDYFEGAGKVQITSFSFDASVAFKGCVCGSLFSCSHSVLPCPSSFMAVADALTGMVLCLATSYCCGEWVYLATSLGTLLQATATLGAGPQASLWF